MIRRKERRVPELKRGEVLSARRGVAGVQIWRGQGPVVSSSLHKPGAADVGVVRGVTEHGNWTSQTLKEASAGLPLMPPDPGFGDREKMLSDSERASSIMAPVGLSAG
ncbi:Hypothetical protein SMAX5B_022555 [Scophthalmus maximus]|uniref:Uncharacterized protein n=1 Tax=Scophthalmus maximus TaxID=52904 RepID=A0A2U9C3R4_SCOMX|nr:Hypothetical protein SMAX5B_022555 [Scophthalmus maximus]